MIYESYLDVMIHVGAKLIGHDPTRLIHEVEIRRPDPLMVTIYDLKNIDCKHYVMYILYKYYIYIYVQYIYIHAIYTLYIYYYLYIYCIYTCHIYIDI